MLTTWLKLVLYLVVSCSLEISSSQAGRYLKRSYLRKPFLVLRLLLWHPLLFFVPESVFSLLLTRNVLNTEAMFALNPPGDSSELDEIHHSVRPFAPRKSDPPYVGRTPSPSATTESTQQSHSNLSHPPPEDPLGTLPDNWEMAYTENGEVYFIE